MEQIIKVTLIDLDNLDNHSTYDIYAIQMNEDTEKCYVLYPRISSSELPIYIAKKNVVSLRITVTEAQFILTHNEYEMVTDPDPEERGK